MKLSDAIMLNGVSKPQGFGGKSVASFHAPCVIGGALQTIGLQVIGDGNYDDQSRNYTHFIFSWPWLAGRTNKCPACGHSAEGIWILWHLNDTHAWTRQQIAEWVATVEPAEVPARCEHTSVRHSEDQYGELCGKKCEPGQYLCAEHQED